MDPIDDELVDFPSNRLIDEALFHACSTATYWEVKALLDQGANPNAPYYHRYDGWRRDTDDYYCIHEAARNPDIAVFDLLVQYGANPKQPDYWGSQPLSYAVVKGPLEMVKHLVELGNNPNLCNDDGASVMSEAALNPDVRVLEYLLEHGAELGNCASSQNELGQALQRGTPERMRFFLSHRWNVKRISPMFFHGAPLENIRLALEEGFDPNTIDGEGLFDGNPIGNPHPMVDDLDEERRALFKEFGASPETIDLTDWYSPLTKGTFEEFLAAVDRHPVADWNGLLCNCFDSALHTVILHREDENPMPFVRYLVEHGADVNLPCDDGICPIHVAAMLANPECVSYLLRHGAFVNQPNHDDHPWRPIHPATWEPSPKVVQTLVRHGAFVDCRNEYGDTPLEIARRNGNEEIVSILEEGLPGPPVEPSEETPPVLYLLMGIPASGKTTFFRRVLADGPVEHVSLDVLGTRTRERAAFQAALAARRSVAVDDTDVTRKQRAGWLAAAKAAGYRTVGLFFRSVLADCLARNEAREGKAKLKRLALLGMSARLELPSREEGFDRLFFVRIVDGLFEIEPWKEN